MSPKCFSLCSIGSRVNPTPDFPFFQRGNSTHVPREIHFLTFSLQIWECGAASYTHRFPKDGFCLSSPIYFFPSFSFWARKGKYSALGFPFIPWRQGGANDWAQLIPSPERGLKGRVVLTYRLEERRLLGTQCWDGKRLQKLGLPG